MEIIIIVHTGAGGARIAEIRGFMLSPYFLQVDNLQKLLISCACVYVSVCLYSSTEEVSSNCKTSETYLRGTDQRCYVVSIIPGASTYFLHLHF